MKFDNHLISKRQIYMGLFLELFASNVFLMTGVVTNKTENQCVLILLLGLLVTLALGAFYYSLVKNNRKSYAMLIQEHFPRFGSMLALLYATRFVVRAGFILAFFYTLLQEFLLQDTGFSFLIIPMILLCMFGASKSQEKRFRTMELLFWFVLLPFLLCICLVVKDVQWVRLLEGISVPKTLSDFESVLYVIALYNNVEFVLFYIPDLLPKQRKCTAIFVPTLGAFVCNFTLLFLSLGVLGAQMTKRTSLPSLRVLQSAKIPGGFLERLDILLIAVWLFGVFCIVCGLFANACEVLRANFFPRAKGGKIIYLICIGLTTYLASTHYVGMDHFVEHYLRYALFIDLPLAIISALFIWFFVKQKGKQSKHQTDNPRRKKLFGTATKTLTAITLCLSVSICLTGCESMMDVESWDYVLTLGVDKGTHKAYEYSFGIATLEKTRVESVTANDLESAIKQYNDKHDQSLQIGHLTAVIYGGDIVQSKSKSKDVLYQLHEEPQIPLTVSLYGVKDSAKNAMTNCPQKKKTLGEYINDEIGNNKKEQKNQIALSRFYASKQHELIIFKVDGEGVFEVGKQKMKGLENGV